MKRTLLPVEKNTSFGTNEGSFTLNEVFLFYCYYFHFQQQQ
ncbi:hypothetical protein [Bacteroides sp. 224]|nr:hypothetical protein [Bacteroides sp. 224]